MDWNFREKAGAEFRSAPFWAWNGKLDPEEVRRQVRVMHDMGMGGFFMHSRVGLETPYLGEEWFRCIDAAIDEAEKLGMNPGLYDEDRWPSGAAGGLVTTDVKYRMRYLEHEFVDADHPASSESNTLGWFATTRDGDEVRAYRAISGPEEAPGKTALRIYRKIEDSNLNYNGGAYLDTMNPEAVDAFIESTYECYFRHFGEKFGSVVPYIFTDEPNYLDLVDHKRRPWTDRLPELYEKEYGESLLPHLPELFYHCGKDFSTTRYRYYQLATKLFQENFGKKIGSWCEKHHIAWTGHLLREENLSSQICSIGDAMPFYLWMQLPGMDLLTERWLALNTAKQLSSVGHQFGKKRLLTESYGCTGWDFPLEGHRVLGDWQYALGVNFRCQHLYWYTMTGAAKRDYPASIGEQSPWYKAYPTVEDYFERLGRLLADGEVVAPLLVVHPVESMWGRAGRYNNQMSFAPMLDKAFGDLTAELLGEHLDFEFGNETLMAEHGRVEDGVFYVGKAAYREVLIPAVETLRGSTLALLEAFAQAGGKVSYLGSIPRYCSGRVDTEGRNIRAYEKFAPWNLDAAAKRLRPISVRDESGECKSILARVSRHADNKTSVFLVNLGCVPTADDVMLAPWLDERKLTVENAQIHWAEKPGMVVAELDLLSGIFTAQDAYYENGEYVFSASFPTRSSRLFVLAAPGALDARPAESPVSAVPLNSELIEVQCSEPNVLVLDHARLRADGEDMGDGYVLALDDLLRQKLGGTLRSGAMLQPWKRKADPSAPAVTVELTYEFCCEKCPQGMLELVGENAEGMEISCNGIPGSHYSERYWVDPALRCVALPANLLKCGKNEITLRFKFGLSSHGLEAIYLRGNFGVRPEATLTAPEKQLNIGSVTTQRMPYYSGNLEYELRFELNAPLRVHCHVPAWAGTHLEAAFDDGAWLPRLGEPWDFASNTVLAPGTHTVRIKVYGSRRNAFGPFYCKTRPPWIGPFEFTEDIPGTKQVVELGLLAKPELSVECE